MSGEYRSFSFFGRKLINTTNFADHEFVFKDTRAAGETPTHAVGEFVAGSVVIVNDGSDNVEFSFGKDPLGAFVVHGELKGGEIITMDRRFETRVFFRKVTGDVPIRVWAW
jgi:hypothetical protein